MSRGSMQRFLAADRLTVTAAAVRRVARVVSVL
jgi:hypothetical protein